MTEIRIHHAPVAGWAPALIRPFAALFLRWQAWRARVGMRRTLDALDADSLNDIGLERGPLGYGPAPGVSDIHRRRIQALGSSFGLLR